MKKYILALAALLAGFSAMGQTPIRDTVFVRDSIVFREAAAVDSSLLGRSIFSMMPSKSSGAAADVSINQSSQIREAMDRHVASNPGRTMTGYRVRIFFDNQQNARTESEKAMDRFKASHPGTAAYRSYQSPYFKVTVGDFRTKSEALELLETLRYDFPAAFVVKESINYPAVDRDHNYVVDTLHVARR